MVEISVIIPAYNAEWCVEKCLDSVLSQTFNSYEIIVVNDGSNDKTLDILNKYKARYPDIVIVIDQKNQGLSITRNNAIKIANGKYIVFVDSDDYIKADMLEMLYNKAISGDFDVVASDVDCVYPDKSVLIESGIKEDNVCLSLADKKALFFDVYPTVWNKIYKREIFSNSDLLFEPGIWFEDVLFYHKLIPNIKSIGVVKQSFYQYIQHENSITYTYSDKLNDVNVVLEKILEYYKAQGIFAVYKNELEYMYVRYMFATYIKRLSKAKDFSKFKKGIDFAVEKVKMNFPEYKSNPYICEKGFKNLYLKCFNKLLAFLIYLVEKNRMN